MNPAEQPTPQAVTPAEVTSPQPTYRLRLFVARDEPNSRLARQNLQAICAAELEGDYELEVIDVFKDFTPALEENILVAPALLIERPQRAKIFGVLQDKSKILSALGLL